MRLAVLSDTHGNAVAFEAVIRDLHKQSPDAVVFLGDLVMRGPQPAECVELLQGLNPLVSVRGNHDQYFARYQNPSDWQPKTAKGELNLRHFIYNTGLLSKEERNWIGGFPTEFLLQDGAFQAELYHASPDSLAKVSWPWSTPDELDELRKHEKTRLVLYGHIHHAFVRSVYGRVIVNSGSIGLPFDRDNRASYCIVDWEGDNLSAQVRRVSYDIDRVIRIARDRAMPDADLFELAVRQAVFPYAMQTAAAGVSG
ncbi:metallophosphoesterase [Paenibacillus sp. J31TS4]|uniref:metallophosphoesterase family protein n=1 Tax=Paenibacillus sp. J31TS4 TaxID=2807195 RepID=UPI001B2CBC52|nr:metallophosphoesterase family protein [Paenibacillus sp. J31TS4]GIP38707.1 metallophosphoesterase [Paenibacillus sp. J31TS4]